MAHFCTAVTLGVVLVAQALACASGEGSGPAPGRVAFAPAADSPLYVGPMAGRPAVGDVNGDGRPDVVIACGTCCGSRPDPKSGHVMVLLGEGKGAFRYAEGSPIKVASSVRKVALGDVNGDRRLDIVAAQHDSYELTVLLNRGDGRFAPGPSVAASSGGRPHTHEVALGDVNGDGRLDALSTNANDGTISVLLGDGRGGFAPAPGSPFGAGRHPYDAIELADLNGDRRLDLVVPDIHGNAILVLLGDGRGAFAPAPGSPIPVGERPGYVAVGDVNGDGRADVCATHDDVGMVDVLLGDGKGRFAPAAGSPVLVEAPVWGIELCDLDADGRADLALGAMAGEAVALLGDGKGGFAEVKGLGLSGGAPLYVAVADLDGDGRQDVVTGNYRGGDVSVFMGRK